MPRRRFNPVTFLGDLMIANMQLSTVLWHRLSSLQSETERSRMMTEKVAAASSGAFEMQKAGLRLSRDIALGKLPATGAACMPSELAEAAVKPALKTLKANAKRLSKPRKPR